MSKIKTDVTGDVRVRYAPSPTGFLHIGNAQSALFNYLFAKHYKGTWVLRIEDTDLKRNVPHGEESQMSNLHWLGIDWDEGPDKPKVEYAPYHQKDRVDIYHQYVEKLLDAGLAYKDYTTEEELKLLHDEQVEAHITPHYDGRWYGATEEQKQEAEAKGLKPAIRLHLPKDHIYGWDDMIKGRVEFNSDNIGGDFIIEKSNGMATYNFAVVIDDYLMDITHVLRGDDHIANTPKQVAVYEALGIRQPRFGHITLIYSLKTHKKLSKRDKNTLQFISQYRSHGYLSEAILNFTAFLGWSPVGEKEIFSREELIEAYDINRMSVSPAFFDQKKLDWINAEYIKKTDNDELVKRIMELVNDGETESALAVQKLTVADLPGLLHKVVEIYKTEVKTLVDLMDKAVFFANAVATDIDYSDFSEFDADDTKKVLVSFKEQLQTDSSDFKAMIKTVQTQTAVKGRGLFMPLNVVFTGSKSAPQITDILGVYSREDAIKLIDKAIAHLN